MFYISLILSKVYYFFTKHGKVTDKSGLLALKIDNLFLKHVTKPKTVIAVTGTNGKTTTCNFLVDLLEYNGYKVTSNREGANLRPGIAKALMKSVTLFNKSKVDVAVIEFDELSSDIILPYIKPKYLIVTNLFRDTMCRNAHTDYVFDKISKGLLKETTLILNADDLISSKLDNKGKKIYFGIDKLKTDKKKSDSLVQDIKICPNCHEKLKYDFIRYHHIGKAHCEKCGFTNPKANYLLTCIDYKNSLITVNNQKYKLVNEGIFNIYNELVAIALLNEMKVKNINEGLESLEIVKTRYSKKEINGIEIITQFAKGQNSIATSRSFDYVAKLDGNKEVILIIDDQHENLSHNTSEIVSWIYDTDFEYLKDESIKRIIVGGVRCYDYKVRLLMAGIDSKKLYFEEDELDTYKHLSLKNTDKIVIVHDLYTVDICNKLLSKIEDVIK